MNQAFNRLLARLGLLCIAIVAGAFAVTQAQRGLQEQAVEPAAAEQESIPHGCGSGNAVCLHASRAAADSRSTVRPEVPPVSPAAVAQDYGYAEVQDVYADVSPPYEASVVDPRRLPPMGEPRRLRRSSTTAADGICAATVAEESPAGYEEPDEPFEPSLTPIQPAQAQYENEVPFAQNMDDPGTLRASVPDGGIHASRRDDDAAGPAVAVSRPLLKRNRPPTMQRRKVMDSSGSPEYGNDLFDDEPAFHGDASFSVPDDAPRVAMGLPADNESLSPLEPGGFDDPPPSTGNGQPGPDELQGPQTPSLTIRKTAPREVQVGKPARLEVVVSNVGKIPAHDVLVRDEVPRGTQLIDTTPAANATPDGGILWQIGTIEPNAEVTVSMNVMPAEEGEIGSVATISFQVAATARSIVTRPVLTLQHSGPQEVLVGSDVIFNIRLANNGTGAAANVFLEEDVPEGLRHYDGRELEFQVGTLKPGESRVLELKLTADQPGRVRNVLVARGDAKLRVQDTYEFEVVAPGLEVNIDGPRRRFLERKATYEISLANPGTAPAKNVELVAKLPPSLKFLGTNNAGHYDSARHAVTWSLESLPEQEMGTVELNVLPIQMGRFPIRVDAKANMALSDSVTMDVEIEGMAALLYTVTDVNDPIEVGGETTYEIHVVNQGSKAATNLRLAALVPSGMEPVRADGPARVQMDGPRVLFDALPRLAPQGDTMYRIYVRGTQPGDKRVQVKLISDEISEPVTKEESTHVYSDE